MKLIESLEVPPRTRLPPVREIWSKLPAVSLC